QAREAEARLSCGSMGMCFSKRRVGLPASVLGLCRPTLVRGFLDSGTLLVLMLVLPQPSTAQGDAARAVRDGAYTEWIPASVLRTAPDTLVVLNPGSARPETLAVGRLGIVELEGGHHPSGKNMIRGFGAGLIVGALVGGISNRVHYGACQSGLCALGVASSL